MKQIKKRKDEHMGTASVENINPYNYHLFELFEELLIAKRKQRVIEERLLQVLGKPLVRKWMDERVQDQYKHEKIIGDIVERYLGRKLELMAIKSDQIMGHSVCHELQNRLDGVVSNIQLIHAIGQVIDSFEIYKVVMGIVGDEYIYQAKLIKILNDK